MRCHAACLQMSTSRTAATPTHVPPARPVVMFYGPGKKSVQVLRVELSGVAMPPKATAADAASSGDKWALSLTATPEFEGAAGATMVAHRLREVRRRTACGGAPCIVAARHAV